MKDFLESNVDEKYYVTNSNYIKMDNKLLFKNKYNEDIIYEIDSDKVFIGGKCGIDKNSKFTISSRIFSIYGNAPTLTACNTAINSKIVVESEV